MHTAIREDSGSYHVGYRVFLLIESKKSGQAERPGYQVQLFVSQ